MTEFIEKREFLAAMQCLNQGWHLRHADPGPLPPSLRWKFYTGQEVGRIAREQLGRGISLPRAPLSRALEQTVAALSNERSTLLFEASFAADEYICRADVLRRNGEGWDLIEVKSGKLPADGQPQEEYVQDLAYTAFVAAAAGLRIVRCGLMLISRTYELASDEPMLVEIDVTDRVVEWANEFMELAHGLAIVLTADAPPDPEPIMACRDCPFFTTSCWGVGIENPIFVLPRLSAKRFEELKVFPNVAALPASAKLTPNQQRVANVIRSGTPQIDPAGLALLDGVQWPAHYLDFESINPAIPWFEATTPYQAMPFQYSLHVCEAVGIPDTHHEFLALNEGNWRRELTASLLERLGDAGSVIMYSSYEKQMLSYLATIFPDLADALGRVMDRLFDLEPVVRKGICHPDFQGRTSIKYVLPALVKGLGYGQLGIQNGQDAGGVFALMRVGFYDADEHPKRREELLEYCKLDTLAMVRVHEALERLRAVSAS